MSPAETFSNRKIPQGWFEVPGWQGYFAFQGGECLADHTVAWATTELLEDETCPQLLDLLSTGLLLHVPAVISHICTPGGPVPPFLPINNCPP